MSLSPSSLSIQTRDFAILTANVNLANDATVKQVNFTSADSNIAMVDPSSVFSSPYRTSIFGVRVGSTTISATTLLNPSGSCTAPSPTTISIEASAWFQTQGGDIHAQGSLSDKIPATATDRNLSLDLNNYPGIISHLPDSQVSFGEGYPSKSTAGNWLAPSAYQGKPYGSFDFFKKKYALQMTTDNFNGSLPGTDGVYYSADGETLNSDQGDWDLTGNRWLIILVDGDVTIPFNVIVNEGSFLAIASSGNITFGSNVRKAQGMFVANGTIDTGSGDKDFAGQGIFAASGFGLNRDFGDARNRTTPAETFVARPDFLMSSYKDADNNLWWFYQKWQELAP